ncbi:MAG: nuclear transport factor 2 family protein [Terriglobales bacterium]
MNVKIWVCLISFAVSALPMWGGYSLRLHSGQARAPLFNLIATAACPTHQAKDGDALIQIEQAWAKALEVHDAEAVGCILADEFQDADPSGQIHDRAETLAQVPHRHPGKNILSELTPHVFGDFGYIRGLATLVDAQGKTVARVRFTDIYVYRKQRWLAVAAQETLLPEAAK